MDGVIAVQGLAQVLDSQCNVGTCAYGKVHEAANESPVGETCGCHLFGRRLGGMFDAGELETRVHGRRDGLTVRRVQSELMDNFVNESNLR